VDGSRFDALTKGLRSNFGRRTLLQGMLSGALAAVFPRLGFEVEAAPRRGCKKPARCGPRRACGQSATCECFFVAGTKRNKCFESQEECGLNPTCDTSADCVVGFACRASCCPEKECYPLCGTTPSPSAASRSGSGGSDNLP
jgi:hypothetical protein